MHPPMQELTTEGEAKKYVGLHRSSGHIRNKTLLCAIGRIVAINSYIAGCSDLSIYSSFCFF